MDENIQELKVVFIRELIRARQENGITQKKLEELSGVRQPIIARIEKFATSPQLDTLLKILAPLGKTVAVVPMESITEKIDRRSLKMKSTFEFELKSGKHCRLEGEYDYCIKNGYYGISDTLIPQLREDSSLTAYVDGEYVGQTWIAEDGNLADYEEKPGYKYIQGLRIVLPSKEVEEAYLKWIREMIEEGTSPEGAAEREELRQERREYEAKAAAWEAAKEKAVAEVDSWVIDEKEIWDEGRKTKEYIHTLMIKSETYKFKERNIFDVGRVINPMYNIAEGIKGGIVIMIDGAPWWQYNDPVRPLTENERKCYDIVLKYGKYINAGIKM